MLLPNKGGKKDVPEAGLNEKIQGLCKKPIHLHPLQTTSWGKVLDPFWYKLLIASKVKFHIQWLRKTATKTPEVFSRGKIQKKMSRKSINKIPTVITIICLSSEGIHYNLCSTKVPDDYLHSLEEEWQLHFSKHAKKAVRSLKPQKWVSESD